MSELRFPLWRREDGRWVLYAHDGMPQGQAEPAGERAGWIAALPDAAGERYHGGSLEDAMRWVERRTGMRTGQC